jgi:hypothetical protein
MKAQTQFAFIGLIVLIALITSIALPITAMADGAPTPPPPSDSSGSAQPAQGADTSAPAVDTSAPAQPADTSAPAADTSAPAQPADTSAPTEPPPATDAAAKSTDAPAATQDPATAVAADTLAPADTSADTKSPAATDTPVVVINSTGTVEPLATQAAADIIATNDPMWCSDTSSSTCTGSFSTFSALLTTLQNNPGTYYGKGTIYIAYDYTPTGADAGGVFINGGALQGGGANGNLTDLTLQGGWGGAPGSTSTFTVPLSITSWSGDVTINDITISGTTFNGLTVNTTGNISVNNVKSNHNSTGSGAYLDNSSGTGKSISVNNSIFDDNDNAGLFARSTGNITLTDVTAGEIDQYGNEHGNGYDGAYLDNSSGTGTINVSSSIFNDNGICIECESSWSGLNAYSKGDIALTNVIANDNYGYGTYLDNTYGNGSITVRSSTFGDSSGENGNEYNGLDAFSTGNITFTNVTADGNGADGAYLQLGGNLSITGGDFSSNYGDSGLYFPPVGLSAFAQGNITLNNVTADNNNIVGAYLIAGSSGDPDIEINDSHFNDNWLFGLIAFANGNITMNNTEASGNGWIGADFGASGAVIVNCGGYNDNGLAGITDEGSSSLTLNSVELSGNGNAPYLYEGTAVIGSTDCSNRRYHHPAAGTYLPIHTINVTGGEGNGLDCTQYGGTQLILPDNDSALFPCPISDSASLGSLTNDKLPGTLPKGETFVSGFATSVIRNGASSSPVNGPITVSFSVPDNMKNDKLAILYWDGSKWVEVSAHMTPDGHFEATTDLTGTFVLVSK